MFLNSLLLYGLALGGVPVVIHLLSKRRFRIVRWAAMDFLREAVQQNRRRLQLRDVILMLIRVAALACLALALARPSLARRAGLLGGQTSTAALLLVDTSYSMGYHNGRETRLDAAKRLARSLLGQFEKNTWCGVLAFSHDTRAPLGDPSQNLGFVEQELDRALVLTDAETNLEGALLQARQLFRSRPGFQAARRELYLLTDMQARAWDPRQVSASFGPLLEELSRDVNVVLLDVGESASPNVAVTALAVSDPFITVDMPVSLVAQVRNYGRAPVAGCTVDFYVDPSGAPGDAAVERTTVDVGAGETVTAKFETRFTTGGDHRVEVRLGPDHLLADNRRLVTLEVIEEAHFLLVDGRDSRPGDAVSGEAGYLRWALSPRDPDRPARQSVVVTETIPQHRLAERDLSSYQAVVLCNVERLSPAAAKSLARQVAAGLGLLIFLGDQTDPAAYNQVLGAAGVELLPARIQDAWGEAPQLSDPKPPPFHTFAREPAALAHPIMAAFNEEDATDLLARVRVYRGYHLDPLPGDDVQVVATFEDQRPAIVERRVGTGSVLLFAFPATTAWSNLPTQYAFPILMLRAANRVTLGHRPPKNLIAGTPLRGYLGHGDPQTVVQLTPPAPAVRRQASPELTPDGRALFEFTGTDRAGCYDVSVDQPGFKPLSYSVNPPAEAEGDLTPVTPEELKQNYPGFEFAYVSKSEDLAARLAAERRGVEIWPWFLCLVFVLLLLESVLALRWAPRQ